MMTTSLCQAMKFGTCGAWFGFLRSLAHVGCFATCGLIRFGLKAGPFSPRACTWACVGGCMGAWKKGHLAQDSFK